MVQYKVLVEGMMCSHCEENLGKSIKKAFRFSVKDVKCSHEDGTCIIMSAKELDSVKIQSAVEDAGFVFKGIE